MEYLAHTGGARVQTLLEHLEGTAELAEQFGAAFGSGDFARMTALAHDLGKYSSAFQRRLRGDLGRVDHSTFGAQAVRTVGGLIPAYCVAGTTAACRTAGELPIPGMSQHCTGACGAKDSPTAEPIKMK